MKNSKKPLYEVDNITNLRMMLDNSAEKFGDRPAFLRKQNPNSKYEPVSFTQYRYDVESFSSALYEEIGPGKRIAILGENRYEWSVSYLAVVNGLGIVVPLDKELPENEIELSLNRAEVSVIIFSPKSKEKVLNASKNVPTLQKMIIMSDEDTDGTESFWTILEKGHSMLEKGNNPYQTFTVDENAMSVLLFTSGTTDVAKAVMLSHRNICSNLMAMSSMCYIDENDIFLSVLPVHHTYECTCGFLCPVYRGSTIAYCDGLRHIAKNFTEANVTMMLGVPLLFENMHKKIWDGIKKKGMTKKVRFALKFSNFLRFFGIDKRKSMFKAIRDSLGGNLRLFISGAAGINPNVSKDFNDFGINMIQGYGLTECAPIAALNRDCYKKHSAAGLPMPGGSVEIQNPDENGIGEIVVFGPNVMLGYYENEEATKRVIDEKGGFHSGDLGYIDKDNFVHITGRKKNVIVTKNGKNIFPEEIEDLLNKSPYISEVMVYGDEENNETVVKASVFPDYDAIAEDAKKGILPSDDPHAVIQAEIRTVNKSLVGYKAVKDFSLRTEEFVKTSTKKIKRYVESNKVK